MTHTAKFFQGPQNKIIWQQCICKLGWKRKLSRKMDNFLLEKESEEYHKVPNKTRATNN